MLQVVHHMISHVLHVFGKIHPRWAVCQLCLINKILAKPEVAGTLPSTKSFHRNCQNFSSFKVLQVTPNYNSQTRIFRSFLDDYPVILRIQGFFSSSFSGKIHHPWRPKSLPQYHRVFDDFRSSASILLGVSYGQWLFLVPLKGGIGGIVHPPSGSLYATYSPCRTRGVKNATKLQPFRGTRNNNH